jgi:hypothetical protein
MSFMSLPPLDEHEIAERKKAFNKFVVDKCGDMFLLPANKQAQVRGLMQRAYYAGYNFRRREAESLTCVGGD